MPPARTITLIAGKDPTNVKGGHSSYVRAHAMAAIRAGFEPHVFCVGNSETVGATDIGIVHRLKSPMRPVRGITVACHAPIMARTVERFLEAHPGPHLIHGFGSWAYVGGVVRTRTSRSGSTVVPIASAYTTLAHESKAKLAGIRATRRTVDLVRVGTEYLWTQLIANRIERIAYENSRLVLVNYESVRRLLEEAFDMRRTEIRLLPYATPSAFGKEEQHKRLLSAPGDEIADCPLIVSVSRHDPRKGINILLDALALLNRQGVEFRACLIGPGALLNAHRYKARELGLLSKVRIPGEVESPLEYLHSADTFVLPSIEEGSGSIAVLEAMQAAVAIVASSCDGIPEDLMHEKNALLVPPGDSKALSDTLLRMIKDSELRFRLARCARATYEAKFSADRFSKALLEEYRSVGIVP
jgi:glycosyltransferase involved in cell wall biosynthesis